jgi:hypothetical protein
MDDDVADLGRWMLHEITVSSKKNIPGPRGGGGGGGE